MSEGCVEDGVEYHYMKGLRLVLQSTFTELLFPLCLMQRNSVGTLSPPLDPLLGTKVSFG